MKKALRQIDLDFHDVILDKIVVDIGEDYVTVARRGHIRRRRGLIVMDWGTPFELIVLAATTGGLALAVLRA